MLLESHFLYLVVFFWKENQVLQSFVVFVDFWNMDHDLGTRDQSRNLRLAALYRLVVESSGLDSREPRYGHLKALAFARTHRLPAEKHCGSPPVPGGPMFMAGSHMIDAVCTFLCVES